MASSSSMSSESDENNAFKTAWKVMYEKCVSGANEEKLGILVRLWKSLEKEICSARGRKLYHRDYLGDLMKLTLCRVIECDWVVDSSESHMICSSLEALRSLASGESEASALEHVKVSIESPWNNDRVVALLSDSAHEKGLTFEILINYMLQDGLDICRRRLEILKDTGYDKVVFNVAEYYVRSLRVPKFMDLLLEKKQLPDVINILNTWISLSFKLKDTSQLYSTLKSIPFSVVFEALSDLCLQLSQARDAGSPSLKLLEETYQDTLICAMDDLFTRKKPGDLVANFGQKVVDLWVDHFSSNVTKIKGEIDVYLKDSTNSELLYCFGFRLFQKVGAPVLEVSLSLIITGIVADLNSHQDDKAGVRNQRLSGAFVLLSKLIPSNLTFRRECILTAFSVQPSQELMDQILDLAKESGFCQNPETDNNPDASSSDTVSSSCGRGRCSPGLHELLDRFDEISLELIASLEKGDYGKATGPAFKSIADKKERNLDGLLLIQGELLTRSSNYDPVAMPVKSLTPGALGLSPALTSDLVSVVNSPRWHFLSWVIEWPALEKQCRKLLENPSIKEPVKDLKYLVIDYTQFDDWSSDEEISPMAGVEPGFENWDALETNDSEQIDEKGISDEESLRLSSSKRAKVGGEPPSPEDIQTLIHAVPGLLKPEPDLLAPKEPIEMDVRIVQLTRMGPVVHTTTSSPAPTPSASSSVDSIANSLISQIQTPVIPPEKQTTSGSSSTAGPQPPPRRNIIKIITPNSPVIKSGDGQSEQLDLIRQLNLARSQGLVVLQQWGDKQVLVHKATGRWIMRQGNRLVTVPPQALGISSSSTGVSEEEEQNDEDRQNNTLKQLAEFDSILESKFNSVPNSAAAACPSSKPTYVILRSSASVSPTQSATNSSPTCSTVISGSLHKGPRVFASKAAPATTAGSGSKPQEDPVTLKRIQQILDDYNEQIRKSPDLQNRPAPRRRTLSTTQAESPSSTLVASPPPTPPPKQRKVLEGGPSSILRQVVVPSSLAASLQASKKQLVFLSGNKKIVALKPLIIQQGKAGSPGGGGLSSKTILLHQPSVPEELEEEDLSLGGGGLHEMLTPPPSSSSLSPTMLSPPSSILDRPSSPPGFGIPMEMTPGQIMEAEISANISDNPYSPLSQCSSSSSNRSESF